jgi:hypothetical protein
VDEPARMPGRCTRPDIRRYVFGMLLGFVTFSLNLE